MLVPVILSLQGHLRRINKLEHHCSGRSPVWPQPEGPCCFTINQSALQPGTAGHPLGIYDQHVRDNTTSKMCQIYIPVKLTRPPIR